MDTQLTVRLPSDLATNVKKTARHMGLKRADIVRLALQKFLASDNPSSPMQTLYEKVESLLGSVDSGVPDLGTNHREHLLKKIRKNA